MNPKNILIVYKKSAYEIYPIKSHAESFRRSHDFHYETLKDVQAFLKKSGVEARSIYRATKINYASFDFVVSVGGDGTFLEAARHIKKQVLLGVNSDPDHSVGSFCAATRKNFIKILAEALHKKRRVLKLKRIKLRLNGKLVGEPILNDILICHRNPAAMSRYWLKVGCVREEQRSSGLWVSTASGSTGAIKSAGGRALGTESDRIQYQPRELYRGHRVNYQLQGGVLDGPKKLFVGSLTREGQIYMDGSHLAEPFTYGDILEISKSPYSLNVIA